MNRFANVVIAVCFAAGLAACGGGYSGFIIPVESELNPWVAPEADEILPASADDDAGEDEGDYEDYEDEEDADTTPAPATAPVESAKPVAQ